MESEFTALQGAIHDLKNLTEAGKSLNKQKSLN